MPQLRFSFHLLLLYCVSDTACSREVEVNGALLPEDEWNDLNPDYITGVSMAKMEDGKNRLIIKTK
jgi:hypothetical protein